MKAESRGKFPGVKLHLEPDECEILLQLAQELAQHSKTATVNPPVNLAFKMGKKIQALLQEDPELLQDRSPERVVAILAKEVEKASLQLAQIKAGKDFSKVDQGLLKKALLKHVEA